MILNFGEKRPPKGALDGPSAVDELLRDFLTKVGEPAPPWESAFIAWLREVK